MIERRLFVAVILLGTTNCSQPLAPPCEGPEGALAIAKQYAETHYPKGTFQPGGTRLQYVVTDGESVWKAFVGPVEYMGGGLQIIVPKRDMKVISALRTQ